MKCYSIIQYDSHSNSKCEILHSSINKSKIINLYVDICADLILNEFLFCFFDYVIKYPKVTCEKCKPDVCKIGGDCSQYLEFKKKIEKIRKEEKVDQKVKLLNNFFYIEYPSIRDPGYSGKSKRWINLSYKNFDLTYSCETGFGKTLIMEHEIDDEKMKQYWIVEYNHNRRKNEILHSSTNKDKIINLFINICTDRLFKEYMPMVKDECWCEFCKMKKNAIKKAIFSKNRNYEDLDQNLKKLFEIEENSKKCEYCKLVIEREIEKIKKEEDLIKLIKKMGVVQYKNFNFHYEDEGVFHMIKIIEHEIDND